jgi:hypothetical protein
MKRSESRCRMQSTLRGLTGAQRRQAPGLATDGDGGRTRCGDSPCAAQTQKGSRPRGTTVVPLPDRTSVPAVMPKYRCAGREVVRHAAPCLPVCAAMGGGHLQGRGATISVIYCYNMILDGTVLPPVRAYCACLGVPHLHWLIFAHNLAVSSITARLCASIEFTVIPKRAQYERSTIILVVHV